MPLLPEKHQQQVFELNRYDEAEKNLHRAIAMNRKFYERFDKDFRPKEPTASETEAKIKQEIAQIMRSTGSLSEAEAMEADAADIEQKAAEQERVRKERNKRD